MKREIDKEAAKEILRQQRLSAARVAESRMDKTTAVINLCKSLTLTNNSGDKERTRQQIDRLLGGKREYVYFIYSPDYNNKSSGVKAMYLLCHTLNELGEEAYIISNLTNKALNAPLLTSEIHIQLCAQGKLSFYVTSEGFSPPEGIDLYVLIACWQLYRVMHGLVEEDHYLKYKENTLFYHYNATCINENHTSRRLNICTEDTAVFYPPEDAPKRSGVYYYANKYFGHTDGKTVCPQLLRGGGESGL